MEKDELKEVIIAELRDIIDAQSVAIEKLKADNKKIRRKLRIAVNDIVSKEALKEMGKIK